MAWEPPLPTQLLVNKRRVAIELGLPDWKAHEVCWCLERVWFGGTYRVTRTSLDRLKDLLDLGHSLSEARTIMYWHTSQGELPPPDLGYATGQQIVRGTQRRRRGRVRRF